MLYDENWLTVFDGKLSPSVIEMNELANSLEKYTSQTIYKYKTSLPEFTDIIITILNNHIPHLLGLSKNHHFGLHTYHPQKIFESLKSELTLEELQRLDNGWFSESQDKLIGVLYMYQMLNMIQCQTYTSLRFGRIRHERLERDNIYFLILSDSKNKKYSMELTQENSSPYSFVPRSIKVDDIALDSCEAIEFKLLSKERVKKQKIKKSKNKTKIRESTIN